MPSRGELTCEVASESLAAESASLAGRNRGEVTGRAFGAKVRRDEPIDRRLTVGAVIFASSP